MNSTVPFPTRLREAQRAAADMPEPSTEALAHSQQLQQHVLNLMNDVGGAIPFSQFMELALYAPGLGYYSAGSHKLGIEGDFITAPEIAPLFSRSLARAILPVLSQMKEKTILEVGAGSGIMAATILLELEQLASTPDHYFILERSADLIERQTSLLKNKTAELFNRVHWWSELSESFNGIVLANELLDALPVHRVTHHQGQWQELYVGSEDGEFTWQVGELSDPRLTVRLQELEKQLGKFPDQYITEINLAAEDWLTTLSTSLHSGVIVLIDYGYPRHIFYHPQRHDGTLMCHYRHQAHANPFSFIGLQDITAHVDFTAIADVALQSGLTINTFTSQAHFLMANGLSELAAEIDSEDAHLQMELANQIKRLTLPQEMGETFKVIVLSKNLEVNLPALAFGDMRDKL